jgi:hypothetical protein
LQSTDDRHDREEYVHAPMVPETRLRVCATWAA